MPTLSSHPKGLWQQHSVKGEKEKEKNGKKKMVRKNKNKKNNLVFLRPVGITVISGGGGGGGGGRRRRRRRKEFRLYSNGFIFICAGV